MRIRQPQWPLPATALLALVVGPVTAQEDGARVRVTRPAVQVDLAAARKSDTPFYEPEVWSPGGKHILHVQRAQLPLRGVDDGKPGRVEVLTYNGKLVGPTIRVRRGERFTVRVVNDLQGPEPFAKVYSNLPAGSPVDPKDPERKQIDPPHGLYTTNLHTHGLHVSPVGKADDVFVEIAPGKSRDFVYQVPADHPAGTFWYHPHKHGSVGYQLASGMAGALIVEGDPAAGFTDLEAVPAIAAAKERVFVLQQLALRVAPQGIGWVYPDDVYNGEDNATPDKPDGILKLPGQPAYQTTTVNGVVMPTVRLRPGEVQRWRFVHAGREVLERLTWSGTDGTVVAADKDSPLHLIALDGLATGACEPRATIDLYPGYRCDVLVKAPAQTGEYFLAAAAPSAKTALRKRNVGAPAKYLVKVVVAGPPHEMRLPDASDHLDRCRPFKDVAAAKAEKSRSIEFFLDDGNKVYKINDQSFSQQTDPAEIRPALGTTELWTLRVKSGEFIKPDLHPFHVHVNPFQVVIIRARKKDGTWVDVSQLAADPDQRPWLDLLGKWKDTLVVDSNHEVTVGMRFADWAGRTVLHCHILDHEDQGMMRVVDILQANGQPLRPIGLQPADSPAPAVRLTDVRGRPCDLAAAGDGRPAVLVFFRGFGCVHCTRQLRVLARETATRLPEKGAVLLAVTDQPIGSPTAALKELGIPDGIEFRLFEDPKGVAFKRYGCLDPDPRHGLFVIDPAGRVRFRYLGDRPLDDAEAVVEAVREFLPTRARRRD